MRKTFLTSLFSLCCWCLTTAQTGDDIRLKYNNPDLIVDLGVGLWGYPMPVDYDKDGLIDLLMSCPDTPFKGIYFFKNIGTTTEPLFDKPQRLFDKAYTNTCVSYADGKMHVFRPGIEYPDFLTQFFNKQDKIIPDVMPGHDFKKIRSNMWAYVDYDGDGDLDILVGIDDWGEYGWDNAYDKEGNWTNGRLRGFMYLLENQDGKYINKGKILAGNKPLETYGAPGANLADYHQGKTRSLAIGFHTSGIYLGQALGGFGATLAAATSWQFTFHSFGLIGMVYSLILIFFLKEHKTYTISSSPGEKKSFGQELSMAFKGLGMLLGNVAFWVILFYFSAPSLPGWATKNWLPTLFSESLNMEMTHAGPLSTMTLALASLVGVLIGGYASDRWVQRHLKGRIYTGVIGLGLTIPALVLIGYGSGLFMIVAGALLFGLGFGIFDVNNMPILCQFVSSRYRATGYGLLNLAGISAGAVITNELGKALDAGYMDAVFVVMIIAVAIAITLQLTVLKPTTIDMKEVK